MAIGNLDLTVDQKLAKKLEAGLQTKTEGDVAPSPTLPKQSTSPIVEARPNDPRVERPFDPTTQRPKRKTAKRPRGQKAKGPNDRTAVWPTETVRRQIRHGFDIFEDQLFSLKEIQLIRQRTGAKKYRLGDLVKEALDAFIIKEQGKD
jgi:hypothetical protein